MLDRREFGKMTGKAVLGLGTASIAKLSSFATPAQAATKIQTSFNGVQLGTCMYCYRDLPRGGAPLAYSLEMVKQAAQSGAGLLEINANYLEPKTDVPIPGIPRIQDVPDPLRPDQPVVTPKWATLSAKELQQQRYAQTAFRLNTPLTYYSNFRKQIEDEGLTPYSYVQTFTYDMSDKEIDITFLQAEALGVRVFSTNHTRTEMGPRLVRYAEKYKMDIGFHNHVQVKNANEIASVEVYERLFKLSPYFKANLDVGHFVASNEDPVAFLKAHPDRITHLHMKDRKRNVGPAVPWGQGDTPLKELLTIIRDNHYPIPCIVEYEHPGSKSGLVETQNCVEFLKRALAQAV